MPIVANRQQIIQTRWMIRHDLPECLAIEHASFPVPWERSDFIRGLQRRDCISLVAEDVHARVIGYVVYGLDTRTVTLTNLAVHPCYRRRGVGSALMSRVDRAMQPRGRRQIECEVVETNMEAIHFLRALGYRATGVVWGRDGERDAYRMVKARGEADGR